jgi:hypothetical protein
MRITEGKDLLEATARRLGIEAEALLRRYYGSAEDARHEREEIDRTGELQASLARLLRLELGAPHAATAPA